MVGDGLVRMLEINRCCCCLDHRIGVIAVGIGGVLVSTVALVAVLVFLFQLKDACYSMMPVALGEQCVANLESEQGGLAAELIALSHYLEDFKLSFPTWLLLSVVVFTTAVLASAMLAAGALLGQEALMLPWLTLMKLSVFLLALSTLLIFYLEAEVFTPGTTVFGLFALFTATGAALAAYLWLVAQSLYLRLEMDDESVFDKTPLLPQINAGFEDDSTEFRETSTNRYPMEVWVRENQELGPGAMPLRVLAAAEDENSLSIEVLEVSAI